MAVMTELPSFTPSRFYGRGLPRPMMYSDVSSSDDRASANMRVDPPQLLGGLMDWASKAHWSMGGMAVKRMPYMGRILGTQKMARKQARKEAQRRRDSGVTETATEKFLRLGQKNLGKEGMKSKAGKAALAKKRRFDMIPADYSSEEESEVAQTTTTTPTRETTPARPLAQTLEVDAGRRQTRSQTAATMVDSLVAVTPAIASKDSRLRKTPGSSPVEAGFVTPNCPITSKDSAPNLPAGNKPSSVVKERFQRFDFSEDESEEAAAGIIPKKLRQPQNGNSTPTKVTPDRKGKRKADDRSRSTGSVCKNLTSEDVSLELFSPSTRRARLARRERREEATPSQRVRSRRAKLAISFASVQAALEREGPEVTETETAEKAKKEVSSSRNRK